MLDSRVSVGLGIEAELNKAGGLGRVLAERDQGNEVTIVGDDQDVWTQVRAPHGEGLREPITG